MTRVLVGTYRKRLHIDACLASMDKLKGVDDVVFIDDSGDPEHCQWLSQYGKVIDVGGKGYTVAMRHACEAAEGQECFWLEEDFTFLKHVNLAAMSEILYYRPYLAEISLLRGPHFPIEHHYGGVIEALKAKGHSFTEVHGVIEHTATFTMNPSLIRAEVFALGWPQHGRFTEEIKRDLLLRQGFRFGYLPGIAVAHDGIRSGHGY